MTKLLSIVVSLSLLVGGAAVARAAEVSAITTGPSQPSKPGARLSARQAGLRVAITTGVWTRSKAGLRSAAPPEPEVVLTTGLWVPSKPEVRLEAR